MLFDGFFLTPNSHSIFKASLVIDWSSFYKFMHGEFPRPFLDDLVVSTALIIDACRFSMEIIWFNSFSIKDNSCFHSETNITSSKLLQQCKNGKASKIILKTEVFSFVNVKTEDGWNLSLRQEKANLDERKESNRWIWANIMLIFVRFFFCSRRRTLISKRQAGR